jgi:ATP synthase protein I
MPWHRPIPESDRRGKTSGVVGAIIQAEKLIQVALVLPCAAFIGWLGGAWLDSRLHQNWIGAVGVAFGGASGLVYVVRLALATEKTTPGDSADKKSDDSGGSGSGT